MRDAQIYQLVNGTAKKVLARVGQLAESHNKLGKQVSKQSLDIVITSVYINSLLEYQNKYWILPIGFFPGNKIFQKILKRKSKEAFKDVKKKKDVSSSKIISQDKED